MYQIASIEQKFAITSFQEKAMSSHDTASPLNPMDNFCMFLAFLLALLLLPFGIAALFLGIEDQLSINFTLPPIVGGIPFLVGWGIIKPILKVWDRLSLFEKIASFSSGLVAAPLMVSGLSGIFIGYNFNFKVEYHPDPTARIILGLLLISASLGIFRVALVAQKNCPNTSIQVIRAGEGCY